MMCIVTFGIDSLPNDSVDVKIRRQLGAEQLRMEHSLSRDELSATPCDSNLGTLPSEILLYMVYIYISFAAC